MRKTLSLVLMAVVLSGCTTVKRDSSATSAAPIPSVSETAIASPVPSDTPSSAGKVGPATVTGDLGAEPMVQIDTTAAPVTQLIISDVAVGTGATVGPGSTVTAHYAGYGATTGTQFDSSWLRGEPATFPLNGVILGWQQGLQGMQIGGRRILVIPANLGYGDTPPAGSGIQPGETLVFVVDLVDSK